MNSIIPSIAVVMSTYNGEAYISQQLDSVLAQDVTERANLIIYVRDDESKDATLKILEQYEENGHIHLLRGENVGVTRSFLEMLAAIPPDIDYVALCDQDDIWHKDKLSRAIEVLESRDASIPQLYCSEYIFCNDEMNPQGRSYLNRTGVAFNKMLYENVVSGNTTVINQALCRLVVDAGYKAVYCHDWWMALVACALGELVYDDFPSLDYRRTGSNVSPTGTKGLALLRYRLRTFFANKELQKVTIQLRKLDQQFGEQLDSEKRSLLNRFLNGGRLEKTFTPVRLRQKLSEEVLVRALFLAGYL